MFLLTSGILALTALSRAQVDPSGSSSNSSDALTNVTMAFMQAQIVPDVLPSFNPKIATQPMFSGSSTGEEIDIVPGILLSEEQTHDPPQWFLASNTSDLSHSNVSWVIAIVDPDALFPQNPNVSQFLHFIGADFVVDPSGVSTSRAGALPNSTALMNTTDALVEFFPPSPPATSDPHRYVCLVYLQPDGFSEAATTYFNGTIPNSVNATTREFFNITDFAANTTLGNPVAGNFFFVGPSADNTTTTPTSTLVTSASPSPILTSATQPESTTALAVTPSGTDTSAPSPSSTTSGAINVINQQLPYVALALLGVTLGLVI